MGIFQSRTPSLSTVAATITSAITPIIKRYSQPNTIAAPPRKPIPKHIRDGVWTKYHGNKKLGICYCCGKEINRYGGSWHCSHVRAHSKDGDLSIDNLRPCCRHCNLSMGDQNMYVYIQQKGLKGPGTKNVKSYLKENPSQIDDKRTNNWRHRN